MLDALALTMWSFQSLCDVGNFKGLVNWMLFINHWLK
jgi:hypothetical protein